MAEMTFEQKYAECKDNIRSIAYSSYGRSEINQFADVVELLAIFNKKSGVTKGDVNDFLYGENDNQIEEDNNDLEANNNEIEEDDKDEINENNDRKETFINSIFKILKDRVVLFASQYPFVIIDNVLCIKENIGINEKNYIFLLISSSLEIFKKFQPVLTTDFETVSYKALKSYLPTAIIKQFGKNSEYNGTAKNKIKQLANDLGLPVDEEEISEIGERNNQERGLDIVGWIPFDDACQNKIVFLCQCACGKNYECKQHDTRRFEHYYEFYRTKPQHTLFIPRALINIDNQKFFHSDYIEDGFLVFERKRIVSLLKDNNVISSLGSKELVEKCLADTSEYY